MRLRVAAEDHGDTVVELPGLGRRRRGIDDVEYPDQVDADSRSRFQRRRVALQVD